MSKIVVDFENKRQIVTKGEAWVYTDSLNLAEVLGIEHKEINKKIRKVLKDYGLEDGKEVGGWNALTYQTLENNTVKKKVVKHTDFTYAIESYKDLQGKDRPYYRLSKDLLVLIIFSFSRLEKAKELQIAYIAEFNRKEKELEYYRARYMGIDVRNSLTDNVKEYLDNPQWYDYVNFTNLVYKSLYGYTAKEIRDIHSLKKNQNIREMLSEKCLKEVDKLEKEIATFLSYKMDYETISNMLDIKFKDKPKQKIEIVIKKNLDLLDE